MTKEAEPMMRLLRWCGIALVVAGVLMVVATLLHPSRETAATIIATEPRLVAAHTVYAFAWFLVLLGLPGLYAAQRGGMRRLGLAGFLVAMLGTYLIASRDTSGLWRQSWPRRRLPRSIPSNTPQSSFPADWSRLPSSLVTHCSASP